MGFMRQGTKVAIAGIALAGFVAFFFVPVPLWHTYRFGPAGSQVSVNVYRSLGCSTVGFGVLYAPEWLGFSVGCAIPVPIPF